MSIIQVINSKINEVGYIQSDAVYGMASAPEPYEAYILLIKHGEKIYVDKECYKRILDIFLRGDL